MLKIVEICCSNRETDIHTVWHHSQTITHRQIIVYEQHHTVSMSNRKYKNIHRKTDWLILIDWKINWKINRQKTNKQIDSYIWGDSCTKWTDLLTDWHIVRLTHRLRDRQTDILSDILKYIWIDRQTDRETERHTVRYTET